MTLGKSTIRLSSVILLSITIAGCGSSGGVFSNEFKPKPGAEPNTTAYRTAAFIQPECALSTEGPEAAIAAAALAPFIAVGVEAVVKRGVDFISTALKKAAEGDSVTVFSTASGEFYDVDEATITLSDGTTQTKAVVSARSACVYVVRGTFGDNDSNWYSESPRYDLWSTEEARTMVTEIGLIAEPDFVLEMPLVVSEDGSAMRLEAHTLLYAKPFKKTSSRKGRDMAVTVSFSNPGAPGDEEEKLVFATDAFAVLDTNPDTLLKNKALSGVGTGWMPMPALPKGLTTDAAVATPYNLKVTITETKDASEFVKFLSGVFEDSKDKIKEEAPKIILELSGIKPEDEGE